MKQLLNVFGGFAGLAVAALVGFALFTLVGGLIIVAGVVVTALLLGGGIYALVTGRKSFSVRRARFEGVRIFDLRTGRPVDTPFENDMIDVTPPKGPKGG
ncbi:hypothetical protein [Xanthobacter agilis]|uniref:Uncharacterized protein n=1 Tax=Xanthobacter agilis TaxID=47492 RepID=A0ABU0LG10_XANAG|nr:hypothetical protein [Xanthobacter agilis]MDQ0506048.1 hypothetical protein [Xanthobacter agilis]